MPSTISRARSGTTSAASSRTTPPSTRTRPARIASIACERDKMPSLTKHVALSRTRREPAHRAVFGAARASFVSSSSYDGVSTCAHRGRDDSPRLAGCFQWSTIIHVKADGSGTIEQRTLLTDAAMEQLRAFAILGGNSADTVDPTSEAQARAMAAAIGPGVTYVSSMPVPADKAQGRDTLYAFTDVTQLRISEQPALPGGVKLPAQIGGDTPPISFALDRKPDGTLVLRIIVPRPAIFPTGPNGEPQPPTLDQITLVKQLLAGARLTVAIEPEGRLVQTSSPFVDGNRVTLIDVDIDQAAADPDLAKKLQTGTTQPEIKAALNSIPGLKITLDPEITIERFSATKNRVGTPPHCAERGRRQPRPIRSRSSSPLLR